MITSINEFRKYNEAQNTDVAQAIWTFYKPEGRKMFLGSESGKVNHEFANQEWEHLSDENRKMIHDWVNNNPWLYDNLTKQGDWQEYINKWK